MRQGKYGYRRRSSAGEKIAVFVFFLWFLFWLALVVTAVVVALHFILKYW